MLSRVEELKLITRCVIADDRNAFGTLVEAYQPRLRRFLMNLTLGDAYLTDDLAQESFIKAYIGLRSFKGMSGFGTWLFRIAYNEYYSHMRQQHPTIDLDDMAGETLTTTSAHEAGDARLDVAAAMASLSTIERTVVTLFYINDLPIKQISQVTQLNQNTVRSHLHRAKSKMQNFLNNETRQ